MMGKGKTVLVIDDDTVTRRLVTKLIEKVGAEPVCVQDGRQAERLIESGRGFDLVLLDLLVPHVSGWDLLAKLREQPGTSAVPVIVFTGTELSEEERAQILEKTEGIADKKDFSVQGFEQLLKKWL